MVDGVGPVWQVGPQVLWHGVEVEYVVEEQQGVVHGRQRPRSRIAA